MIDLAKTASSPSGSDVSWPFLNLPARKLTDYYHLIKSPESLKRIDKKVRGIQGRDDPTGITMFKSWSAFEEHVSLIWRNAREYNEDGSEISILADKLEVCIPPTPRFNMDFLGCH
jgi:hypothetical protein